MKCSIKKRELPPLPKVTTKQVRNDHIYGFGRRTYEYHESAPALDLQIPPTRSNSLAAERERELKVILDLAREGKTATEIAEASGCTRVRVTQTIKRFAEYGAKLAPEPKKKRKSTAPNRSKCNKWTDEMTQTLIELHRADVSYSEIGARIGVTKNAVTCKVQRLVEEGVLKSRTAQIMWSDEDMERLMKLRASGKTWGEISDATGRKLTACQMAYRREMERRQKCKA